MLTSKRAFSAADMTTILAAVAIAAFIVAIATRSRDGGTAGPAAGMESATPITAIRLQAAVRPTRIRQGQEVRVGAMISVVGGPAPVTFAASVPRTDGGTYDGSITTMVDQNATHGFDLPRFVVDWAPGIYTFMFRASSGRVSATRTVSIQVIPEVFSPPPP